MQPHGYQRMQESEVAKAGHRPHLQMLVTDARLMVVAIILRLEKRPVPRGELSERARVSQEPNDSFPGVRRQTKERIGATTGPLFCRSTRR